MSNYAIKSGLKSATGSVTSQFTKKYDLPKLINKVDKLDIDKVAKLDVNKLKTVAADLRNLRHEVIKEVVKKDVYDAKIKGIEDKILHITKLATTAALNAGMKDVKNQIPSITNLATNASLNSKKMRLKTKYLVLQVNYNCFLTTVENKIPKVSDLVKKADYDAEAKNIKDKVFITSDYNEFTNNTLDVKMKAKKLVNEPGLNE